LLIITPSPFPFPAFSQIFHSPLSLASDGNFFVLAVAGFAEQSRPLVNIVFKKFTGKFVTSDLHYMLNSWHTHTQVDRGSPLNGVQGLGTDFFGLKKAKPNIAYYHPPPQLPPPFPTFSQIFHSPSSPTLLLPMALFLLLLALQNKVAPLSLLYSKNSQENLLLVACTMLNSWQQQRKKKKGKAEWENRKKEENPCMKEKEERRKTSCWEKNRRRDEV
jgi:hypothetical protein